jgi:hypothetical protein
MKPYIPFECIQKHGASVCPFFSCLKIKYRDSTIAFMWAIQPVWDEFAKEISPNDIECGCGRKKAMTSI